MSKKRKSGINRDNQINRKDPPRFATQAITQANHYEGEAQIPIPSQKAITDAKHWVDENEL
ncbi:MAG: CDIF630_02480 family spore surface protein [Christensenellales bacterium]|jgi:hypothetical protein